jgi:hypothetical protein
MSTKNDFFPSKFLKGDDIDTNLSLTINGVKREPMRGVNGQPGSIKPVIYFEESPKGLVLNVTNWDTVVKITKESDSDNWPGKMITLVSVDVEAFGEVVRAIRVIPAQNPHDLAHPKPDSQW